MWMGIAIAIIYAMAMRWINDVLRANVMIIIFRYGGGSSAHGGRGREGRVAARIPQTAPCGHGDEDYQKRKDESE